MFGYVKPVLSYLTEEEQAIYKSVYCGLCHSLGQIAGQSARFTLSYDFAFLALLRMAVLHEAPVHTVHRCPRHPLKGCSAVVSNGTTLDYCAALSVLLGYESIRDALQDEKGFYHFKASIAVLPARRFLQKAENSIALPKSEVRSHLKTLAQIEKDGTYPTEAPAEVFGNLLAEVSAFGIDDEMMHFAVSRIMFSLGKWIYLVDAADDFEKDKKNHRFNPFLPKGPDPEILKNSLEWELKRCDEILRMIPDVDPQIRRIIRNILFYGTANVLAQVLSPNGNRKESENERPV